MALTKTDKEDIKDIVGVTVSEFYKLDVKPEFAEIKTTLGKVEDRLGKVEDRLGKVEDRLGKVEVDVRDVKRQLTDLKWDAPTRKEFHKHEARISRLEQSALQ